MKERIFRKKAEMQKKAAKKSRWGVQIFSRLFFVANFQFILEQKGLKSGKKALKTLYFSYLKKYPYISAIDGGPIRNTSKNSGQKVFLIGTPVL